MHTGLSCSQKHRHSGVIFTSDNVTRIIPPIGNDRWARIVLNAHHEVPEPNE